MADKHTPIKYLGSKRKLLSELGAAVGSIANPHTIVDLFSGTSRVGYFFKSNGYKVIANDMLDYAACIARCYIETDIEDVEEDAKRLLRELSALPGKAGYFTETFCEKSRFFHPKNGERVDAIREAIEEKDISVGLKSVLLVALMEAADRVDSTVGLQMAYLKSYAPRAHNSLELRMPALLPQASRGKGAVLCADAADAVEAAKEFAYDVVYADPPYNQHSYLGNYHIWESLVKWDKPETYGVACKRVDARSRKSDFNFRKNAGEALQKVLHAVPTTAAVILSFSSEGFLTKEEIEYILHTMWGGEGRVSTTAYPFRRYVGARCGIYNGKGEKVGTPSHLRNKEYIFVAVHPDRTGKEA